MKTRGAMYKERKDYIETMAQLLSAFPNFGELKYRRTAKTEGEYLKLTDLFGKSCFLDITSMPLKDIYRDVSNIVVNAKAPQSMITNPNTLITVARYFL